MADNDDVISGNLSHDTARLQSMFGDCEDLIERSVTIVWPEGRLLTANILYMNGMVDTGAVEESLIRSLFDRIPPAEIAGRLEPLEVVRQYVLESGHIKQQRELSKLAQALLSGSATVMLQGGAYALVIPLAKWEKRAITESKTQSVVRGPQEAFTESLITNTTMLRRRIQNPKLRMIDRTFGSETQTSTRVFYMEHLVDRELLQELLRRLDNVKLESVLESEYLEEYIAKPERSIFPTVYNTDRPDTIAAGLLEGRIAIAVDGTPFLLMVPAVFTDFVHAAEDHYQHYLFSTAIRFIRLIALFTALLAPSIYISITTFHPELVPTMLLLSLAAQREGIPFPAFIEAFIMEITFEVLREAGIRMPRMIGQAVSIVGTIVVGQAAVEAGIVSPAMVIVVAITGISSFVLPSYSLAIPIRLIRFVFMAAAASFGLYGLTIALVLLVIHLSSLDSLGKPYLESADVRSNQMKGDKWWRAPYWKGASR